MKVNLSPCHKIFQKRFLYFSKSILFAFLSVLNSLFLQAKGNDSIMVSENQNATVFIGSGITVHGLSYICNAEIIKVEGKNSVQKEKSQKASGFPAGKSAVSKKNSLKNNSKEAKYKKLQKELSAKFLHFYYSESEDIKFSQRTKQKLTASTVSNVLQTSDPAKSISSSAYILNSFEIQSQNQKFYTKISHLLSAKLTGSFLRGPPLLS